MKIITIDEYNSEVVRSEVPVLVDFFAPWCGPCKGLATVLEDISATYEGTLKVLKVDIDEPTNYELVTTLGIRSVPTMIFYKKGTIQETIVGAVPKNKIIDAIENLF